MNLKKLRKTRGSRLGVTEVTGAVLMMAITLAVGFAVWFWANSAATNAESSFGHQVNANVSCLNLNFVIINANFSSTNPSVITLWFYNLSVNTDLNLTSVTISSGTQSTSIGAAATLAPSIVKSVTINTGSFQFTAGQMYSFAATGSNLAIECSAYSPSYSQIAPSPV